MSYSKHHLYVNDSKHLLLLIRLGDGAEKVEQY